MSWIRNAPLPVEDHDSTRVTLEDAQRWMLTPDPAVAATAAEGPQPDKAVGEALFGFGSVLVSEILARATALDGKAATMLGWSTAALAFLFTVTHEWQTVKAPRTLYALGLIGIASATASAVSAFRTLKARTLPWLSQSDWFNADQIAGGAARVRASHLLAMLNVHSAHTRQNIEKARTLVVAQWSLFAAACVIAVIGCGRLFGYF